MAALRTEKPVLRSPPSVTASAASVTIPNGSKSHILSDNSSLGHNTSSGFPVNSTTTNLAVELASGANGGFALASALAGILGLTFPATLLTSTTNSASLASKSATNSTNSPCNTNTASVTITTNNNNNNNSTPTFQSHTDVSNWLSTSDPELVETVDSVAVQNQCKSPETVSSVTSISEQFSVPLPTSIFPIDSNMLSFPFPLPAQQTCSDVSSDTGSAQSPFTPQQTGTSSAGLGLGQSDTHQSSLSLKFGSDSFNFDSTSPFLTAAERDRKQREFIPESKKDDKYWERRRKNNEAAKRSREKRRQNDIMMECRINELNAQNQKLRQELIELKIRFEVPLNDEERSVRESLYSSSPAVFNGMSDSEYKMSDTLSQSESGTPKPKSDNLDNMRNGSKHQSVSPFLSVNGNQTVGDSVIRLSENVPLTNVSTVNNERNGSLPSQLLSTSFLPPQLNNLNSTDLVAVKRIFSNLVAASSGGVVTTPNPNPTTVASTAILSNPLLDNPVTPTSALTNLSLNSSNCAVSVALLLQQAGLLQQSNPIVEAQKLFGLHDSSIGSSADLISSQTAVTSVTNAPCSTKLSLVSPTQSDTMTWSDCADSPLDLSLCLRVKSNTNTIDSQLSDSPSSYEPQVLDKRYQDRRRRNNEAVRRCRENKRARLLGSNGPSCTTTVVSGIDPNGGPSGLEPGDKLETENRALRNEVRALRKLLLVGPPNSCDQASSESPTSESQLVSTAHGLDENMLDSGDYDQKIPVETTTTNTSIALSVSTGYESVRNDMNDNRIPGSPNCLSAVDVCSNQSSPHPISDFASSPLNSKHRDLLETESRVSDSSNTITPTKSEAVPCIGDENDEGEDTRQDPLLPTPKSESADVEVDLKPATNGPRLGPVRGRRRMSKCSTSRVLSRHSTDLNAPPTTLSGTYFHTHEYSQNSGKEDGVVS